MSRRLTGVEAKAVLEDMMADICAHADDVFEGTAARFALVVWPEGFEAQPDAIAVFAQPEAQPVAVIALETAAKALAALPDASQPGIRAFADEPNHPTKA